MSHSEMLLIFDSCDKTVSYAPKTKTKNPRVFIFGKFRDEKTEKKAYFPSFLIPKLPKMKTRGFLVF